MIVAQKPYLIDKQYMLIAISNHEDTKRLITALIRYTNKQMMICVCGGVNLDHVVADYLASKRPMRLLCLLIDLRNGIALFK